MPSSDLEPSLRFHPSVRHAVTGLLLTVCSAAALAAAEITGRVFEDRNGNALWEAGEPGLAAVQVSNGTDIATTDAQGRYALPVDEDCTVFVIKPRGFRTPVDARFLPRFYYHHVPAGTPDAGFKFRGLAPTGAAPASVDFPLYPQAEPASFRVALVSDPQPYTTQELAWYARDTVAELAGHRPVFGIALGDLVGDNLDLHTPYVEANALAGFPWYNVIGNHDLNYDAPTDAGSDAAYRRVFGPSTYAFHFGGAHFLILNNVYWQGKQLNEKGRLIKSNYRAALRPEQLRFAQAFIEAVPAGELIVVCSHIPMVYREPEKDLMLTPEFPKLLKLLSGHPHTLSVSGHMHFTYGIPLGAEAGYTAPGGAQHLHLSAPTSSGSWYAGPLDQDSLPVTLQRDGTPPGYLWLDVQGSAYTITYKGLRRSADEQMRLYAPEVIADALKPGLLQANFYLGNDASTLRFRVDGQAPWAPMQRVPGFDPAYAALRERTSPLAKEGQYRLLPAPVPTEHLWQAPLPAALPVGVHAIEVEAADAYGRTFTARTLLRVVASAEAWRALDERGSR